MKFYAPASPPQSMPPSHANRLRIIGGRCRGRVLRFPSAPGLRPTPDRVRETLFNWLGQDLAGRTTLDLFAGTGALSLEALSRGALRAVAVDRNAGLVDALRRNAQLLGLPGLEAHRDDAIAWLGRATERFDVIFLDPPYSEDLWTTLLPGCAGVLADEGVIYAEAGRRIDPPSGLVLRRADRAGHVYYHLLART